MRYDFVTSDTHLLHSRICEYEPIRKTWCDGTVESMTEAIITAWQRVVKPHHNVLHLGDFFMGPRARWAEIRARLPGNITLIRGNHDPEPGHKTWEFLQPVEVYDRLLLEDPRFGRIECRHDPAEFDVDDAQNCDLLLHGHLHSGNHRQDVPEAIRAKCRCVSIERLPSQPEPLAFERIAELVP